MSSPKLNDYTPGLATAKVSVAALWCHLEALEAIANDPAKVKNWGEKIFKEIQACQVA